VIARGRVRFRVLVELGLACLALVGAAASWVHARHLVAVAPIAEGQPVTLSLVYEPQQLLLTMLLAMLAGVLAVAGIAGLRQAKAGGL
jgi:hypothetical protein